MLETLDGNWRKIEAATPVEQSETVYNFTVANDHDYFVGETGFLVHNAQCKCNFTPFGGPTFTGFSGPPSRLNPLNPILSGLAGNAGGKIGDFIPGVAHPIGACAEADAANQALNAGWELENGIWQPVTRGPRIIPPCPICQRMFGFIP